MKDWYLRQTSRDRLIVLIVGVLAFIGLLYAFVWYPMASGLDNSRTLINSKRETLQKVEVASAELKSLSGAASNPVLDAGNKETYSLIDERIRAGGLSKPDRVEPVGDNGARVQFSEVEFDKLVLVLAELEQYGLTVDNMSITRSPKTVGMVSAKFKMEKN